MQMTTVTKRFGLACAAAGLLGLAAADASAASLTPNGGTRGQRVYAQSDTRTGRVHTAEVHARHDSHRVDLAKNIGGVTSSGRKRRGADMNRSVLRTAWLVDFARPQFDAGVVRGSDAQVPAVTRDAAISALQVAISEVCGDKPGQYDLHSGGFSIQSGGASTGVMNLPHVFLGALGAPGLDALETAAIWANIASHQDQLAVNPIPEPGSLFLFAVGASLVAFAAARGRR